MIHRKTLILSAAMMLFLSGCATTSQTTTKTDDYDYSVLSFPSYLAENPVRYLQTDGMGMAYDGWQDFGPNGEIQTHPWPWTTYTYQMYSYFIRNDLQALYAGVTLPTNVTEMPAWVAQTDEDGHRVLWFSMTSRTLPSRIELVAWNTLVSSDESASFLRAEYELVVQAVSQRWIVYFMETDGVFSSYSIRVNESFDTVRDTTDAMVSSYRLKPEPSE